VIHKNTNQTKPSRLAKKKTNFEFHDQPKKSKLMSKGGELKFRGKILHKLGLPWRGESMQMQAGRSLHLAGCYSLMHVFSSQVSLEQLAAFLAPAAHCTLTISCGHGMDPSQPPCGILDQKGTATIIQYTKSTCIIAESNQPLFTTKISHIVLLNRTRERLLVPAHPAGKVQSSERDCRSILLRFFRTEC
jgi:hypothetical protein